MSVGVKECRSEDITLVTSHLSLLTYHLNKLVT